jgi:hypothetical protein
MDENQEFLEAVQSTEEWLDPSDWFTATITKNLFRTHGYAYGRLTNGENIFIPRNNDVLTRYPIHLDCLPKGTEIHVRMSKQKTSTAEYRAIEAVIPGEPPNQYEEVEITNWTYRWGSGRIIGCGCAIFLRGKTGDVFNLHPGDKLRATITLSRKGDNYIGVVLS